MYSLPERSREGLGTRRKSRYPRSVSRASVGIATQRDARHDGPPKLIRSKLFDRDFRLLTARILDLVVSSQCGPSS